MSSLENKVIVITGATGVLGSAMCHGLAESGANIVVLARTQSAIDKLTDELKQYEVKTLGISANVLSKDSLQAAQQQIIADVWANRYSD